MQDRLAPSGVKRPEAKTGQATTRVCIISRMTEEEEVWFWESHDFANGVLEEGPEVSLEFDQAIGTEDPSG